MTAGRGGQSFLNAPWMALQEIPKIHQKAPDVSTSTTTESISAIKKFGSEAVAKVTVEKGVNK